MQPGHLSLAQLVGKLSTAPAALLSVAGGALPPGAPADLVLFDAQRRWAVRPEAFRSLGRNSAFKGMELTGSVACTLAGGQAVYTADWFESERGR